MLQDIISSREVTLTLRYTNLVTILDSNTCTFTAGLRDEPDERGGRRQRWRLRQRGAALAQLVDDPDAG